MADNSSNNNNSSGGGPNGTSEQNGYRTPNGTSGQNGHRTPNGVEPAQSAQSADNRNGGGAPSDQSQTSHGEVVTDTARRRMIAEPVLNPDPL
ncbi:hypothetical protein G7054_g15002 [Neopestalotiopsis clavispora]|nr:hypothetical protein G7054_g15002 [Neopestalotiopsis clavispora]